MDDSEVTLNVCLGKQFTGGELFFRGVRCEKHVNSEAHPEVREYLFVNFFQFNKSFNLSLYKFTGNF